MLKKILKSINEGCRSVSEIAEKMDMQESAVITALKTLERQGYLSSDSLKCPKDSPACLDCPIAKAKPRIGVTLCITEKGMRHLEKS
ncbi:ArsR family transcriptional regulator [Candidatus Micrarchaeota archaeon]|nr:ArsR family transcriptional regulator [Candidatus Micrarchaeota archaeon]